MSFELSEELLTVIMRVLVNPEKRGNQGERGRNRWKHNVRADIKIEQKRLHK